jgi:hypothetical protein
MSPSLIGFAVGAVNAAPRRWRSIFDLISEVSVVFDVAPLGSREMRKEKQPPRRFA